MGWQLGYAMHDPRRRRQVDKPRARGGTQDVIPRSAGAVMSCHATASQTMVWMAAEAVAALVLGAGWKRHCKSEPASDTPCLAEDLQLASAY